MWLVSNSLQQRSGQSRFANARFTGEQYDLTLTALCSRPAAEEDFKFFFTSHKLRQTCRSRKIHPCGFA
jgi:hypothetical protein